MTVRTGDALDAPRIEFEFGLERGLRGCRQGIRYPGMEDAHAAAGGFGEDYVEQSAGRMPN